MPKRTINRIKTKITDISKEKKDKLFRDNINYQLVISQEIIRHIYSDNKSFNKLLYFINMLDIIITNFDEVRYSLYSGRQHALRFKKRINNNLYVAVEVLSNSKGNLRTQTFFIESQSHEKKKPVSRV